MNASRGDQRHRWRLFVDRATRAVVGLGGVVVIAAIGLIFFYLAWVVFPLFQAAHVGAPVTIGLDAPAQSMVFVGSDEGGDTGYFITANGLLQFFDPTSGSYGVSQQLTVPDGDQLLWATLVAGGTDRLLLGTVGGATLVIDLRFPVELIDGVTKVIPNVGLPFGSEFARIDGVQRDDPGQVAASYAGNSVTMAAVDGRTLTIAHWNNVDDGIALPAADVSRQLALPEAFDRLMWGPRHQWLILTNGSSRAMAVDVTVPADPRVQVDAHLYQGSDKLAYSVMMAGAFSLLTCDEEGGVQQWMLLRGPTQWEFVNTSSFQFDKPIVRILPEHRRRGFIAIDNVGVLHLAHVTSGRTLAKQPLGEVPRLLSIDARANTVFAIDSTSVSRISVANEHPEISWRSMWQKVWYEGYQEPVYAWQSSSADNDFEPKFSLTPLMFGTLKGAFYALLIALPAAVLGAIYTAFFMSARMRAWVKPSIEIMAALPTVILGFLAGLWLAPLVEANLGGFIAMLFIVPAGVLVLAWVWSQLPDSFARFAEGGWHAALLMLPIVGLVVLSFSLSGTVELAFFDGDLRGWLKTNLDLDYDQRNSLVVGLAMGLAVIPTVFSISEDAIYSVPRHLVNGSLALGATTWQTLVRVVLLTASPGIFSAGMIGLGRAVGETMIVLMATGNTPIMDLNIFEGMRTFAANIAVELPESEVDSTHYRVLFLAALVLFGMTFVVNTAAEVVRQRLRARYGNL